MFLRNNVGDSSRVPYVLQMKFYKTFPLDPWGDLGLGQDKNP